MCGRNIVEQKVEYKVYSKHSRTQTFGRNVVEQNVKCNVSSKLKRTKIRVQGAVET